MISQSNENPQRPRILFVNRSYWPDAEATGQLLTELCEDLSPAFDLQVIAGQPNQVPEDSSYRRRGEELRDGVLIRRVRHTQFPKTSLTGRLINYVSFLVGATVATLRSKRPDVLVVETDPPLLCWLGALARWWHRCRLVVYLQDIHPDVAIAVGKLSENRLTAALRWSFHRIYRRADQLVVLSEDMRQTLLEADVSPTAIRVIPNWIDTREVRPIKQDNSFREQYGLQQDFVVMYSGNMGLCQQLETVLLAAEQLQDIPEIKFMLVGDGASRARLEDQATSLSLNNVRFLDYQPKAQLSQSLSAADLHLVPLAPDVTRYLMPSKLYGILASGTPLIAVTNDRSELARFTEEERVGFVVPAGDPGSLASHLRWAVEHRAQLEEMGHRARRLAVRLFDRSVPTAAFQEMLTGVLSPSQEELPERTRKAA